MVDVAIVGSAIPLNVVDEAVDVAPVGNVAVVLVYVAFFQYLVLQSC